MPSAAAGLERHFDDLGAEARDLLLGGRADVVGRNGRSEPPRGGNGLQAGHARADDKHLGGADRAGGGNQHGKNLRQGGRPQQHGAIAGDGGLRRENVHHLGAGDSRQQFQGEERGPAAGELLVGLGLPQRVAEPDNHLARRKPRQVVFALQGVAAAGADLEDHFGGEDLVAGGGDFGALIGIKPIGKAGRHARSRLHEDFDARLGQRREAGGDQRDTRFARKSLLWNANDHGFVQPILK